MRDDLRARFAYDAEGRHPRRKGNRRFAPFGIRQILLEHPPRRFVQTVVGVNWDVPLGVRLVRSKLDKTLRALMH